MEAVICLPVLLLVSLGVAQFAHIWLCRTMVQYAAYCGARATLTAPPSGEQKQAAFAVQRVCAPLAFANPFGEQDFSLPGTNENQKIASSGAVLKKDVLSTSVTVDGNQFHTATTVKMSVPLILPLAGSVIGKTMTLFKDGDFKPEEGTPDGKVTTKLTGDLFPRIILTETVHMAKPYRCTWNKVYDE